MATWTALRLPRRVSLVLVALGVSFTFLYILSRVKLGLAEMDLVGNVGHPAPAPSTADLSPVVDKPLNAPNEYIEAVPLDPYCAARFGTEYLEDIRDHAFSYCAPDAASRLTCFHSHTRSDGQVDTLCVGQGVSFDTTKGKFWMHCPMRELANDELERGAIRYQDFHDYWYETGPHEVIKRGIDIYAQRPSHLVARNEPEVFEPVSSSTPQEASGPPPPASTFLLLKREGEGNLWHCMMEIFSSYLTIDALSMSRDPLRGNEPFFNVTEEAANTQVVILDDRDDGPYFDLWTLFARRKPLRLHELTADPAVSGAIQDAKFIIPLTGSSNPFWQDDQEVAKCNVAPTLSVFVDRVLGFYEIPEPPSVRSKEDPIILTFIDRQHRRLRDQDALFKELEARYPHIAVRLIDFAAISFPEQIRVIRETDILVGVHGAGHTHTMFMRHGAGAMVEIQPAAMDAANYRDLAYMRGLSYFRLHTTSIDEDQPSPEGGEDASKAGEDEAAKSRRDDWHFQDVVIEPERFFLVMDAAIKSMYTRYPWSYDIDQ